MGFYCCGLGLFFFLLNWNESKISWKRWSSDFCPSPETVLRLKNQLQELRHGSSDEQDVQFYGWSWSKGHTRICCWLQNCSKDKWSVIAHHTMIACWCHFLKWCDDTVVGPLTHLMLSAFVSIKLTGALCKYDFGQRKPSVTDLTQKRQLALRGGTDMTQTYVWK